MPLDWISVIEKTNETAVVNNGVKLHDIVNISPTQGIQQFTKSEYPVLFELLSDYDIDVGDDSIGGGIVGGGIVGGGLTISPPIVSSSDPDTMYFPQIASDDNIPYGIITDIRIGDAPLQVYQLNLNYSQNSYDLSTFAGDEQYESNIKGSITPNDLNVYYITINSDMSILSADIAPEVYNTLIMSFIDTSEVLTFEYTDFGDFGQFVGGLRSTNLKNYLKEKFQDIDGNSTTTTVPITIELEYN